MSDPRLRWGYKLSLIGRFFHGIGCLRVYQWHCVSEIWLRWWHPATWLLVFPLAIIGSVFSSASVFEVMPLRPSRPVAELTHGRDGILPWWWAWTKWSKGGDDE